ncbi:unnamed protein product [Sphagnum troendelagicum]
MKLEMHSLLAYPCCKENAVIDVILAIADQSCHIQVDATAGAGRMLDFCRRKEDQRLEEVEGGAMVTRLVLPLQITVASAIVLALSVRHIDQYRQHLERFGLKPSQEESKEQQQQQQSD